MSDSGEELIIPLVEEDLQIEKAAIETAKVFVEIETHEELAHVLDHLARHDVEITRLPVGREVEAPEAPRREGDVLIVPIMEEVLVVRKQLRVTEELRIALRRSDAPVAQTVPVRKQTVRVERRCSREKEI